MVWSSVVFWSDPDVAFVAGIVRGAVSCRSISIEANPPSVDHALRSVPEDSDWQKQFLNSQFDNDQFDDTLVRCYGYLDDDRQLLPPHTSLYNKWKGGMINTYLNCVTFESVHLRNIKLGKSAVIGGLHIGACHDS